MSRMTGPDCVVMCNLINTRARAQDGNGEKAGAGMGTETRGRTQDENGDGSGYGNESCSGDGNGDEDGNRDGNKDGSGEGGGDAKKCKKPHTSCRRDDIGSGGDLRGKRKQRIQERIRSLAADPDNIDNSKEAWREAQGAQSLRKKGTSEESVSPLSRLIRGCL